MLVSTIPLYFGLRDIITNKSKKKSDNEDDEDDEEEDGDWKKRSYSSLNGNDSPEGSPRAIGKNDRLQSNTTDSKVSTPAVI